MNICNCFANIRISYQLNKFSYTDPVTFYSLITLNVFELTETYYVTQHYININQIPSIDPINQSIKLTYLYKIIEGSKCYPNMGCMLLAYSLFMKILSFL